MLNKISNLVLFYIDGIIPLYFLFRWRRLIIQQKLILVLLIWGFFIDLMLLWTKRHNNLWVAHFYTIGEYLIILMIFYYSKKDKYYKQLIYILGIIYSLFWTASKFTFEPLHQFDSFTAPLAYLVEMVLAIWLLSDLLREDHERIIRDTRIWFISGILIYVTGNLLFEALYNTLLKKSPEIILSLFSFFNFVNIIAVLLYGGALLCRQES